MNRDLKCAVCTNMLRCRQLSGSNSTITRVMYQLDDIPGNEAYGDEDLRNSTLATVYDT